MKRVTFLWILAVLIAIAGAYYSRAALFFLMSIFCIHILSRYWAIPEPPRNWNVSRVYRPRQTGAGDWLEAPVAELDKSTCGKLLASRLRREPGLHVVVGWSEPPRIPKDPLYDPEVDGF